MSDPDPSARETWEELGLDGLRARLVEIKDLLEQAAAVGVAQDLARLEALADIDQSKREDGHGPHGRRRYR